MAKTTPKQRAVGPRANATPTSASAAHAQTPNHRYNTRHREHLVTPANPSQQLNAAFHAPSPVATTPGRASAPHVAFHTPGAPSSPVVSSPASSIGASGTDEEEEEDPLNLPMNAAFPEEEAILIANTQPPPVLPVPRVDWRRIGTWALILVTLLIITVPFVFLFQVSPHDTMIMTEDVPTSTTGSVLQSKNMLLEMDEKMTNLSRAMAQLKTDVASELNSTQLELASSQTTLASSQQEFASLQKESVAMQLELVSLHKALRTTQEELASTKRDLVSMQQDFAATQDDVTQWIGRSDNLHVSTSSNTTTIPMFSLADMASVKMDHALYRNGGRVIEELRHTSFEASFPDRRLTSSVYIHPTLVASWKWNLKMSLGAYLGLPVAGLKNAPQAAISDSLLPGECFAFHGSTGQLSVAFPTPVLATSITLEHNLAATLDDVMSSAPKSFTIWGYTGSMSETAGMSQIALGSYTFDMHGGALQHFPLTSPASRPLTAMTLAIEDNYGADYTCVYRFRVHAS